jgi:hypothetical protein
MPAACLLSEEKNLKNLSRLLNVSQEPKMPRGRCMHERVRERERERERAREIERERGEKE